MWCHMYTDCLYSRLRLWCFLGLMVSRVVVSVAPQFYQESRMSSLRLPEELTPGTVVYRLQAEDRDRDYPLTFSIRESLGNDLFIISSQKCLRSEDFFCQADVILRRKLDTGAFYVLTLLVQDSRGEGENQVARVEVTQGRPTPFSDIFLSYQLTVPVPEDTSPSTVITTMTVRKRKEGSFGSFEILGSDSQIFEIRASNLVASDVINGTVTLTKPLDYETKSLHSLNICALKPYMNEATDTRNVACIIIAVVVLDVQDMPPAFLRAPPVTRIPLNAVKGDVIAHVEATDGDRGRPRKIRYSVNPSSSLYSTYFSIDPDTGDIAMNNSAMKLKDSVVSMDPIMMTVTAEEVTSAIEKNPVVTDVEIAFVILDVEILTPKFVHEEYVGEVFEDSPHGRDVYFNSPFLVEGLKGLFSLSLDGDNEIFSVHPGVVKDEADIAIKVKNPSLLDYETLPVVRFKLVARQVSGFSSATGTTEIVVKVIDVNDNAPVFSKPQYEAEIYENIKKGGVVLNVMATDADKGEYGEVRYTALYGSIADRLDLDPMSGLITCNTDSHNFNNEKDPEYILTVEARDNQGKMTDSNTATARILLRIRDVNDSPPRFLQTEYQGVLDGQQRKLREPVQVTAVDDDKESPNNVVVYEIERGPYSSYFRIDRNTGNLDLREMAFIEQRTASTGGREARDTPSNSTFITVRVKASDLGTPPLSQSVDVNIYKKDFEERMIKFIYPSSREVVMNNMTKIEKILNTMVGGASSKISYVGYRHENGVFDPHKSEITALIKFAFRDSVVDVGAVQRGFNSSQIASLKLEMEKGVTQLSTLEDENRFYVTVVAILCSILALAILIMLLCCFCQGCPIHDNREKEKNAFPDTDRTYSSKRTSIWNCLPRLCTEIYEACGFASPARSRLQAWSADQQIRLWEQSRVLERDDVDNQSVPEVSRPEPRRRSAELRVQQRSPNYGDVCYIDASHYHPGVEPTLRLEDNMPYSPQGGVGYYTSDPMYYVPRLNPARLSANFRTRTARHFGWQEGAPTRILDRHPRSAEYTPRCYRQVVRGEDGRTYAIIDRMPLDRAPGSYNGQYVDRRDMGPRYIRIRDADSIVTEPIPYGGNLDVSSSRIVEVMEDPQNRHENVPYQGVHGNEMPTQLTETTSNEESTFPASSETSTAVLEAAEQTQMEGHREQTKAKESGGEVGTHDQVDMQQVTKNVDEPNEITTSSQTEVSIENQATQTTDYDNSTDDKKMNIIMTDTEKENEKRLIPDASFPGRKYIYAEDMLNDLKSAQVSKKQDKRSHLLEKKSIFTIAYDDMQTQTLRPDSAQGQP